MIEFSSLSPDSQGVPPLHDRYVFYVSRMGEKSRRIRVSRTHATAVNALTGAFAHAIRTPTHTRGCLHTTGRTPAPTPRSQRAPRSMLGGAYTMRPVVRTAAGCAVAIDQAGRPLPTIITIWGRLHNNR